MISKNRGLIEGRCYAQKTGNPMPNNLAKLWSFLYRMWTRFRDSRQVQGSFSALTAVIRGFTRKISCFRQLMPCDSHFLLIGINFAYVFNKVLVKRVSCVFD